MTEIKFKGHPDQHYGYLTYSQHGEDIFLINLFKILGIDRPSYLDLGAHHPENISNTKLLYDRGSRGINVEANPNLIQNFKLSRPEDINIQCGVVPFIQTNEFIEERPFYMYSDTCGRNTFSEQEVDFYQTFEKGPKIKQTLNIPVHTVNEIIQGSWHGVFPDFLNCDLEGLDYEILSNLDLEESAPVIICVETRKNFTQSMIQMMKKQGYFAHVRLGENLIFVRNYMQDRLLE